MTPTTTMEAENPTLEITPEPTRNPDTVVFRVNRPLLGPGTGLSFPDAESARDHPVARALFAIRGVASVWIIGNEVTVTKDERMRWNRITSRIIETLKRVLA